MELSFLSDPEGPGGLDEICDWLLTSDELKDQAPGTGTGAGMAGSAEAEAAAETSARSEQGNDFRCIDASHGEVCCRPDCVPAPSAEEETAWVLVGTSNETGTGEKALKRLLVRVREWQELPFREFLVRFALDSSCGWHVKSQMLCDKFVGDV